MIGTECQLPNWVEYLSALSTPAIAVLAVLIGYFQWRTNHQRAVLDLFERRMAICDAIRSVIAKVQASGSVSNEDILAYLQAIDRVGYFFGQEVTDYLDELHKTLCRHQIAEASSEEAMQKFREICGFYVRFPELISPYIKMHQKAPPF